MCVMCDMWRVCVFYFFVWGVGCGFFFDGFDSGSKKKVFGVIYVTSQNVFFIKTLLCGA